MKVAIIGGGIFGCTCAIRLANNNISTTIFEEKNDCEYSIKLMDKSKKEYLFNVDICKFKSILQNQS